MRSMVAALAVIALVLILWLLSSWQALQITTIQVSGADEEYVSAIHDAATRELAGTYLGIMPRTNAYFYPRSRIRETIAGLYHAIESVDVFRTDRHTIVVTVHEKVPAALVCASLPDFDGDTISLLDSDSCYFVDAEGILFKKAPSFSGTLYDRYYMPDLAEREATSSAMLGSSATSTATFGIIRSIYSTIEGRGITVDAMLTKPSYEYELYVRNPGMSSSTAIVYFNTIASVDEQISNLISFWDHEVSRSRVDGKGVIFESIDVRYPPNVYHRLSR